MISWYIDCSCISPALLAPGLYPEEPLDDVQALDEGVDLGRRGVQIERRPRGRRNSIPDAHRPRAVVPDADRDALLVQDLADVVRVDVAEHERDRRPALLSRRRADDAEALDLLQPPERVLGDRVLVGGDVLHADRVQVVDR